MNKILFTSLKGVFVMNFFSDIGKSLPEIAEDVRAVTRDTVNCGGIVAALVKPTSDRNYKPYFDYAYNQINNIISPTDIPILGDILKDEEVKEILKNVIVQEVKDFAISQTKEMAQTMLNEYVNNRRVGYGVQASAYNTFNAGEAYCMSKINGNEYKPLIPFIYFEY